MSRESEKKLWGRKRDHQEMYQVVSEKDHDCLEQMAMAIYIFVSHPVVPSISWGITENVGGDPGRA